MRTFLQIDYLDNFLFLILPKVIYIPAVVAQAF